MSAVCAATLQNLISFHPPQPHQPSRRKCPDPHQLSAPGPSTTAICSELHQLSAPKPSRTSSAICAVLRRNLINHLRRDPMEPCRPSAPEGSGILPNTPELSPKPDQSYSGPKAPQEVLLLGNNICVFCNYAGMERHFLNHITIYNDQNLCYIMMPSWVAWQTQGEPLGGLLYRSSALKS